MLYPDMEIDNTYMQNRELSWLKFNERVLEEAQNIDVPLLERLKFVSIFTSNLDEFFMIRVGSLTDLALMDGNNVDSKTGMSPKEQLDKIFEKVVPLYRERDNTYDEVEKSLREFGICNLELDELTKPEITYLDKYYENYIHPILSPQVVDSRHPFPHLSNKNLYLVCVFSGEDTKFGLIPVTTSLPEFIVLPGDPIRYVLTEKVILEHADDIFEMYHIENKVIIAVTRNADISPEDEIFEIDDDFRDRMKKVLKKRARLSPVRLEVQGKMNKKLTDFLLDKLKLKKYQVFTSKSPLVMNYSFRLLSKIPKQIFKQLSYPKFEPVIPTELTLKESITSQCKKKDILLFYPYHQIDPFLHLLKESAEDPNVISIKITIYRLASNSRIIEYLCMAAENNKDVTVLMELKARFDEKNNIEWAERLEDAGCNVIYGFEGFKVHSKICLITRRDRNKINYITQIGTGNYNEKTSKLYTDLSLMTANQDIGQEAMEFFKNMSISNLNGNYNQLFVAPYSFKNYLLALIDHETRKASKGEKARIIIKSNSLTDVDIIHKLLEASMAGVEVKLIIRGICCLLPEIKEMTDHIEVRSIVGRYLEHSRIYCFGTDDDIRIYISSADMMTRNTSRRVEIACPILDKDLKEQLLHMLDIMLSDNVKARLLHSDGTYSKVTTDTDEYIDSQEYFIKEALSETHHSQQSEFLFQRLFSNIGEFIKEKIF